MRPPDLVIFDCDGVLIESERIAVRIGVEQLSKRGWPLTETEYAARFSGRTVADNVAEIASQLGEAVARQWLADFWRLCWDACATELRCVDGVTEALDAIPAPTCVASSSSHEVLRRALGIVGLYDRFGGHIFSATEVSHGKPAPDLFLHAAARMGVDPALCAVVEDSPSGVRAARSAGMRVFAYAAGLHAENLLTGAATTVFHHMRELPVLMGFVGPRVPDRAARQRSLRVENTLSD